MTRILVVEDERALNDITCDTLRDAGYEATGCLDANRAFDAMRGTLYDLVVSDISSVSTATNWPHVSARSTRTSPSSS
ncbi:hypothetical protein [Bifidobacterium miconisargentati]|uniref:hypothetical protein n=1 Tax=Bifidobacterium miconisargentati TaxID=2834437 RepID=UPI001BDD2918|nr:hypothetical protein [Bifidobacterium miconisargentati]MBW3091045.1 hypothetical protein [Bifidobacterium miconisargentati]